MKSHTNPCNSLAKLFILLLFDLIRNPMPETKSKKEFTYSRVRRFSTVSFFICGMPVNSSIKNNNTFWNHKNKYIINEPKLSNVQGFRINVRHQKIDKGWLTVGFRDCRHGCTWLCAQRRQSSPVDASIYVLVDNLQLQLMICVRKIHSIHWWRDVLSDVSRWWWVIMSHCARVQSWWVHLQLYSKINKDRQKNR